MSDAHVADHHVWGSTEVLGCHNNSSSEDSGNQVQNLPRELATHLAANVVCESSDHSTPDSALTDKKSQPQVPPSTKLEGRSVGSQLHDRGECAPCLYNTFANGCKKGYDCDFCHMPHARRSRPRPGKSARQKCKDVASMIDAFNPDPEQVRAAVATMDDKAENYMETVLRGIRRAQGGKSARGGAAGRSEASSSDAPLAEKEQTQTSYKDSTLSL
eukprot:TRINITY_DN19770_c1_g1_i2.p1 TRINITY_DN19770_c1_g1~~TRINITY_DN19770_c1_g1_i2.p1  ORF type:complete len:216 (+),score=29.88 TRINITY_DN19770_c1_g1_i2:48-695(+)